MDKIDLSPLFYTLLNHVSFLVFHLCLGLSLLEKPTKCVTSRKLIEINAQVQFIDFEGQSDGESLLKILSQLRPRRVIVIRGLPENVNLIAKHCSQSIGARVFTPGKGDIIDATTENHIYQVKLTEALVAKLQFHKVKDAEVAWLDSKVRSRNKKIVSRLNSDNNTNSLAKGSNVNNQMEIDNEDEDITASEEVLGLSACKLNNRVKIGHLPNYSDNNVEEFCFFVYS